MNYRQLQPDKMDESVKMYRETVVPAVSSRRGYADALVLIDGNASKIVAAQGILMKVTLLGTGPPSNPERFQSSALMEIGSDLMLFDAGGGAVHQLLQTGVDLSRVGPVFITHHHFDHINDLFAVIITTAMRGRERTLDIYGLVGTQKIVNALLDGVYAQDIRFRLEEDRNVREHGYS